MQKVLIVEDSKFFGDLVRRRIVNEIGFEADWVTTLADAKKLVEDRPHDYFVALLDLNLPDAPNGKVVDYILTKRIPVIVFTGVFSDDIRDFIWSKKVVDYVLKEGTHNIDYILEVVQRIYNNRFVKVLVVDDSKTSAMHIGNLLDIHQYEAYIALDGYQALEILSENPDIKLVIIDYFMPNMDGFQLTKEIRKTFSKNKLAIIGISAQGNNILSARFIKNGANDFISKPFLAEEFFCRISHNIEMLEYIDQVKTLSNTDYLTKLYNRRYFFNSGQKLFENAKRGNISLTVAMLDIDFFKIINDRHGHYAGDKVLVMIANILQERFRKSDLVARFGGEEFCIITSNLHPDKAQKVFDEIRENIQKSFVEIKDAEIRVTVSIGVCITIEDSLDGMVKKSDKLLYEAKNSGRNKVICR